MKILGIINKDSAVAYHRIIMPLLLMEDVDVHITNNISEETFEEQFDIVFYSRLLSEFAFEKINEMRAKHGFKIVVDIDDHWELDKWHCMHTEYSLDDIPLLQINNLINADAVFVTHDRLYLEARKYNKNIFIVPNAIPKSGQFAETYIEPSDRVRLFWQGSVTHEWDINLIQYAIENMANSRGDKIKMVMAGYHPQEPIWQRMAKVYTCGKRLKHKLIPGAHYRDYYKAYHHADICLVPLVNSGFNGMKSNLKILEAANLGLPVVAHNVHPYKDMPVRYANGTHEWVAAMKYYIDSEAARYEEGQKLQEFCIKNFNYYAINKMRKDILQDIRKQTFTTA